VLDRVLTHLEKQTDTKAQITREMIAAEIDRRRLQAETVRAELGHPLAWFPRFIASMAAVFVLITYIVRWLYYPGTPLAELDPWVAGVIATIFAGMFITGK
jgi:hypothetical protein